MTPFEKRQSPFTKRMIEEMQIRGLADSTIDSYSYHVDRFASFIGKKPENANQEEIRNFQPWMKNELQTSWSQLNQAVSALRWFYTFVYKRDWTVRMIPFGHVPKNYQTSSDTTKSVACCNVFKTRNIMLLSLPCTPQDFVFAKQHNSKSTTSIQLE